MKEEEEIVSSRNLRGKLVEARNSKDLPPPSLRRRRIYHPLYVRFTGAKVICCSLLSDSSPSLGPRNLPLATRIRLLLFSSREDRRGRDGQADRITTRERGERKERREDRSLDLEGDGLWERLTRLMGPRHPCKYRRYPASIEVRLGCEPGCRCRFT